ncbi:hypothetical protein [Chitinophaga sp. YIM B06452]|uniref:hypothetical protein n=1 Tax=Chitinophaga sp. YIM B06452 TaxID=3082158 RepID=UPI0031FF1C0E
MMKKMWLIIGCLISFQAVCHAQTFNEWFRQKKTQRQYLIQQIAAFRLYVGYLSKGYKIAREGTGVIRQITNGEFSLHDAFLQSLRQVNPKVRQYGRIADFIALQAALIRTHRAGMLRARTSGHFTGQELDMFGDVFAGMLDDAAAGLEELIDVLTDDQLEMEDNQRILRIDKLYAQASVRGQAARALYTDITLAATDRERLASELEGVGALYNLKRSE